MARVKHLCPMAKDLQVLFLFLFHQIKDRTLLINEILTLGAKTCPRAVLECQIQTVHKTS